MNAPLRTIGWIGALAASLAGLVAAGDRLPPPPLPDLSATWTWLERTDPAVSTFALLRLVALAVVTYLLAVTVALVAARATRAPLLVAASRCLTLPSARRLVHLATGAGLALALVGSTATLRAGASTLPRRDGVAGRVDPVERIARTRSAIDPGPGAEAPDPSPPDPSAGPTMHAIDDDLTLVHLGPAPPDAPTADPTADLPAGPTRSHPAEPAPPSLPPPPMSAVESAATAAPTSPMPPDTEGSSTSPAPAPAAPPATPPLDPEPPSGPSDHPEVAPRPAAVEPDADAGSRADARHTIVAGEHLWGVAEQALAAAWGVRPAPSEIASYLHRLVEANRSVLAIADDPDLVFPGQVFALPPVAAR